MAARLLVGLVVGLAAGAVIFELYQRLSAALAPLGGGQ